MRQLPACLLFLAAILPATPIIARAQGVTADSITIGQSGALSGPADEIGRGMQAGAAACFNAVNQAGGIFGRKIRLVSLDDGGEAERAKSNTQKLLGEENVLALLGYSGDHTIKAALPLIEKSRVPFIGPASGEQTLREPVNRYIFNVRASYVDETEQMIDQLVRRGITRIALFYQNDPYGRGGLAGVDKALRDRKLAVVLFGSVDRHSTNVISAAQNIHKSGAQAVIIASGARPGAAFIREMKKLGSGAQFVVLSNAGARTLATQLGDDGRGVAVSQVVPLPTSEADALGREYLKAIGGANNASFASLEGYVAAKVLVEGIRKSGKNLSRESLVDALEKTGSVDLGGYKVKFSATSHNGSSHVEPTVIGAQGMYRR